MVIILGATGSVASILAYIDDRLSPGRSQRAEDERALRAAIVGIETALNDLEGYTQSLETLLLESRLGGLPPGASALSAIRPGFGQLQPWMTQAQINAWIDVRGGVLTAATGIGRDLDQLVQVLGSTGFRFPRESLARLQAAVRGLNDVIYGIVDTSVADFLAQLRARQADLRDGLRDILALLN